MEKHTISSSSSDTISARSSLARSSVISFSSMNSGIRCSTIHSPKGITFGSSSKTTSSPFSSIFSKASKAANRSIFPFNSCSAGKGFCTSIFAVSNWWLTFSNFVRASASSLSMFSSTLLIRVILPSASEPISRLWLISPLRLITNLRLKESKVTFIANPAYSPIGTVCPIVFICLHSAIRAVPASFLS